MKTRQKPHLVLIRGGGDSVGPVTRLGLWSRVEPISWPWRIMFITTKLLLLASILYFIFG